MESQNDEEFARVPGQGSESGEGVQPPPRLGSFLDPLGLFEELKRDVERAVEELSTDPVGREVGPIQDLALRMRAEVGSLSRILFPLGRTGVQQEVERDNPSDNDPKDDEEPEAEAVPPLSTPVARRHEVLRLHAQGLTPQEIAPRVGVTGVRVGQILREEGIELRPREALTEREIKAQRRRQEIVAAHHRGLTPREIADQMEVSLPLVYRGLAEAGLRPNVAAEVARAKAESGERLQQMLQLRQAGVSGAEIARRLGISEPRVVQLLKEFRAPPPPGARWSSSRGPSTFCPRWRACDMTLLKRTSG
ncbi:MAG: helix-turn-helix domain-containing protein [Chloroflexota bacterium]